MHVWWQFYVRKKKDLYWSTGTHCIFCLSLKCILEGFVFCNCENFQHDESFKIIWEAEHLSLMSSTVRAMYESLIISFSFLLNILPFATHHVQEKNGKLSIQRYLIRVNIHKSRVYTQNINKTMGRWCKISLCSVAVCTLY